MLMFNCTKAALDFFTITRQGTQYSLVQQPPHKILAEDLEYAGKRGCDDNYQWHWVLHCVSIKRKKYLLAMDYHSRYCLVFSAPKKGDDNAFLNAFEKQLKGSFRYWITQNETLTQEQATEYVHSYDRCVPDATFYQRSDRSVMSHIKEVVWHLESLVSINDTVKTDMDFLLFGATAADIPRTRKGETVYFRAHKAFYQYWLNTFKPEY
ncbi:hypothetical protein D5R81_18645 [Parashewanella spongiae]|uniref:DUF6933 domain-containing protein n=1 Tax=Parashewanella spongiae TaxID=342950 RepID=A0A3A6TXZ4_9GAMM|nr:hypothetical protein [Parashewanella spongiae]MCL1080052.1 hypothetical protein [Parashewanella spongiae]RJY05212.1 hypothetical protein D5R81_18645 [Parashewanella spongiae]